MAISFKSVCYRADCGISAISKVSRFVASSNSDECARVHTLTTAENWAFCTLYTRYIRGNTMCQGWLNILTTDSPIHCFPTIDNWWSKRRGMCKIADHDCFKKAIHKSILYYTHQGWLICFVLLEYETNRKPLAYLKCCWSFKFCWDGQWQTLFRPCMAWITPSHSLRVCHPIDVMKQRYISPRI